MTTATPSYLNYEQITRSIVVDGNDDNPDYDGSISYCTCHQHPPPQTCTTELCFNYATLTECLKCSSSHCQNNKFTKLYSKKLEVRPVEHKGYGLFCLEDIERGGEFIKEYVGELISTKEFIRRMKVIDSPHLYIMELKPNTFLDARRKGSISRFINHSCEPNCTVEVWTVGKKLRVGIFSLKAIPAGSELTFDYRWERSLRPPTKCYCGTKSCRGYLEVDEEDENELREPPTPVEKTGLSVPQVDAYRAALSNQKGGEWLVNKRVKVWWDGNQRYFDADVLDYDPSKGVHTIQYLVDGQVSKEILALNREQVRERYSPWLDMKEENLTGCVRVRPLTLESNLERSQSESLEKDCLLEKKRRKSHLTGDLNRTSKDSNGTDNGNSSGSNGNGGSGSNGNGGSGSNGNGGSGSNGNGGSGSNGNGGSGSNGNGGSGSNGGGSEIIKPVWDWLWLDESRSDVTIAKKTEEDLSSGEPIDDQHDDSRNGTAINLRQEFEQQQQPISFARPALSPSVKVPAKLSFDICRWILQSISLTTDHLVDFRGVMKLFVEIMKTRYETFIRQQLQEFDSGREMVQQVMLYGRAEKVDRVQKLIQDAAEHIRSIKQSSLTSLHDSLLRDQPQIFTTDWRRKISSDSMRLLSFLAQSVGIKTPLEELYLNSFTNLSFVPNSSTSLTSGQQQHNIITEDAVLRTTRMSLISLCKAINATHRVELHALVLLQRCFDLLPSSSIGSDILSLLAVCLLLSMKANGAFKPKHLSIVIIEAYPLIFNRKFPHDTATVKSSLPYYRNRILEMEKKIFKTLYCDLFIPDITNLPLRQVVGTAGGGNGSNHLLIQNEEIDLMKRVATFLTTLLYRVGSKTIDITSPSLPTAAGATAAAFPTRNSILCNEGLKILPFDLIQWSCSLIVCILHLFLQTYHHNLQQRQFQHLLHHQQHHYQQHHRQHESHHYQHQQGSPPCEHFSHDSNGYLPLNEELLHHTLHSLAASSVFVIFYQNALSYYSPLSPPGGSTRGAGAGAGISNTHSIGLLWSVSLISHTIQCILSSSEIRSVGEMLSPSLSFNGTTASSSGSIPRKLNTNCNSLFGTQQQWKTLVARVPFIYLKWIESWNLSQISLPPSSYHQPMKTRSLYLMMNGIDNKRKGMESPLDDVPSTGGGGGVGEGEETEDHIGWIDGASAITPIYIEDRVPIFIPSAPNASTSNDRGNADDDSLPQTQKRKLEISGDQNQQSSSSWPSSSASASNTPSSPPLPSSDGIVYCHCSPQELKKVNFHQQQTIPQTFPSTPSLPDPSRRRVFALIPSPSIKTQLRELKKYHQFNSPSGSSSFSGSSNSNPMKYISSSYGISSLCLSEITMLQYLHYFALPDEILALNSNPHQRYYEGVGCPIAMVYDPQTMTQTHAGLYYNQLSSASKGAHSHDTLAPTPKPPPATPAPPAAATATEQPCDDPDSILQLISTHRLHNSQESQSSSSSSHPPPTDGVRTSTPAPSKLPTSPSSSAPSYSTSSSSSELPSSTLLTYLYGLYPATECHLPLPSFLSSLHLSEVCSPAFLFDLSKQLIDIFYFCYRKGILFKYIPYDHIYLTTRGRLILQSLQGAVFIAQDYGNSYPGNQSTHKVKSSSHSPSHTSTTTGGGGSGSHGHSIPTTSPFGPYLSVTPPEVIYGAVPDQSSTVWSVMAVCYLLFTGIPPVKLFSMETKKYLQHLLALLGTPGTTKAMVTYYSSLPYAKELGTHIVDRQTGQAIEVKSRLEKTLRLHLPQHLKEFLSSNANAFYLQVDVTTEEAATATGAGAAPFATTGSSTTVTDTARGGAGTGAGGGDEGNNPSVGTSLNPLYEIFLETLQLDPHKRPSFETLLQMPFFSRHHPSSSHSSCGPHTNTTSSNSSSSDHLMDVGRILEHIRAQEESFLRPVSTSPETSAEFWIEKSSKRRQVDDHLMSEIYGLDWKQRYRIQRELELKIEEEKLKIRLEKELEMKKKLQEEEERRVAEEEKMKKPRVMKDGKTSKRNQFLPASLYRHPHSSLSETIIAGAGAGRGGGGTAEVSTRPRAAGTKGSKEAGTERRRAGGDAAEARAVAKGSEAASGGGGAGSAGAGTTGEQEGNHKPKKISHRIVSETPSQQDANAADSNRPPGKRRREEGRHSFPLSKPPLSPESEWLDCPEDSLSPGLRSSSSFSSTHSRHHRQPHQRHSYHGDPRLTTTPSLAPTRKRSRSRDRHSRYEQER